jgi:hypothetical protein
VSNKVYAFDKDNFDSEEWNLVLVQKGVISDDGAIYVVDAKDICIEDYDILDKFLTDVGGTDNDFDEVVRNQFFKYEHTRFFRLTCSLDGSGFYVEYSDIQEDGGTVMFNGFEKQLVLFDVDKYPYSISGYLLGRREMDAVSEYLCHIESIELILNAYVLNQIRTIVEIIDSNKLVSVLVPACSHQIIYKHSASDAFPEGKSLLKVYKDRFCLSLVNRINGVSYDSKAFMLADYETVV